MRKLGIFIIYIIYIVIVILVFSIKDLSRFGVVVLLLPAFLISGAFFNFKKDNTKKEITEEIITEELISGQARHKNTLFLFLANKEHIIIKGRIGRIYIKKWGLLFNFDYYNDIHITESIEIVKYKSTSKRFNNSKQKIILEALENLQDNLEKLQLDDKDENIDNNVNNLKNIL